ncbi:hypothetical protein FA95DRAFT_1307988 [Auriscalpium vulgare]|uniref:Uncharacterized protein n=1 Tax=Auriscalpium vulgare TaxID=40419 RepID=A0ACB8RSS4_9AGAM|nr:hypothetical protein FA95DRAFT_1307988 [Auriscalpium vulgare]
MLPIVASSSQREVRKLGSHARIDAIMQRSHRHVDGDAVRKGRWQLRCSSSALEESAALLRCVSTSMCTSRHNSQPCPPHPEDSFSSMNATLPDAAMPPYSQQQTAVHPPSLLTSDGSYPRTPPPAPVFVDQTLPVLGAPTDPTERISHPRHRAMP